MGMRSCGASEGVTMHRTAMNAMKISIMRMPGTMPPMYIAVIEDSVKLAYTIIAIDGGIRMPSVPPAASEPNDMRAS